MKIPGAMYGSQKSVMNSAVLNAEMAYADVSARLNCVFRNLSDPGRAVKHAVLLKQKMEAFDRLTLAKALASTLSKPAVDKVANCCTQPQKYPNV